MSVDLFLFALLIRRGNQVIAVVVREIVGKEKADNLHIIYIYCECECLCIYVMNAVHIEWQ